MKSELLGAIDRASVLLKALSGRSRLMILCHLQDGEKQVAELVRLTGARDTVVSQQLALLRREHVVRARRQGQRIFYSLASEDAARLLKTVHALFCREARPRHP